MARVGLLGGTFDPIHIGHLIIAEAAYDVLNLDSVEFVVANDPPHKPDDSVSPAELRVEMVRRAIGDTPHFRLNLNELERSGPSFTVDTLSRLVAERPEDNFHFIIGADSLRDLHRWRNPGAVLQLARLAVINRPGIAYDPNAIEAALPGTLARVDFVSAPAIDISSTDLRIRSKSGKSIRFQTVDTVRAFIDEMRLYR